MAEQAPTGVAVIVKLNRATLVGVPVIAPEFAFRLRLSGSEPLVTAKVKVEPPAFEAVIVWLYAVGGVSNPSGKVAGNNVTAPHDAAGVMESTVRPVPPAGFWIDAAPEALLVGKFESEQFVPFLPISLTATLL